MPLQSDFWEHNACLPPAEVFEAERRTSSVFQEMPWHYLEVAHLLLTSAKECFSSKEHMEVRLRLCTPFLPWLHSQDQFPRRRLL